MMIEAFTLVGMEAIYRESVRPEVEGNVLDRGLYSRSQVIL